LKKKRAMPPEDLQRRRWHASVMVLGYDTLAELRHDLHLGG
jgi:hypothetical protein